MKAYAFGVDVGGTTVKLGLFTAKGELFHFLCECVVRYTF